MYYFKSLFDLNYQRSKGQALVYFLFVFLMSIIVTGIISVPVIFLDIMGGGSLRTNPFLQYVLLMNVSTVWALLIFYHKRLSYYPWFIVAILSPFLVLHAPGYAAIIAGFVPIAILSMLKSRR